MTALAFSNDEELGFDPTVVDRPFIDNTMQIIYKIGRVRYRTEKELDTHRVAALVSRAARIWQVVEIDDNNDRIGDQCVLKDVWLSWDAKTEQTILSDIQASLEVGPVHPELLFDGDLKDSSRFFLTIIPDKAATVDDKEVEYNTDIYTRGRFLPEGDTLRGLVVKRGQAMYKYGQPHSSATDHAPSGAIDDPVLAERDSDEALEEISLVRERFEKKKHCRTLFKEIGHDLQHMENLGALFQAVVDAGRGKCGYGICIGRNTESILSFKSHVQCRLGSSGC